MLTNQTRLFGDYAPIESKVSHQLDSVRGVSSLLVLFAHGNQIFVAPTNSTLYGTFGIFAQASVMAFFVLSGFLIFKSMAKAGGAGRVGYVEYMSNRLDRLVPTLLFSVVVLYAFYALSVTLFPSSSNFFMINSPFLAKDGYIISNADVVGSIVFLNGFLSGGVSANSPLWSLPYEFWYYVVAGLIFYFRGIRGLVIALLTMAALAYLNKIFLVYSLVWFSGGAVAILHNAGVKLPRITWALLVLFASAAAAIAVYYILSSLYANSPSAINLRVIVVFNLVCGLTMSLALYLILLSELSFFPIFKSASKFSYTLYIVHFPILLFVYGVSQREIHGNLGLSVLFAMLSCLAIVLFARICAPHIESLKPIKGMRRLFAKDARMQRTSP